jgi:hypothetical protein
MHGIQCDKVEFQNSSSLVNCKYILVHTGMYWYVHVQASTTIRPPSCAYWSQQNALLGPFSQFSSTWQSPPQSDHPGVACHCQSSTAISSMYQYTSTYWYILVFTSMYQYVLLRTSTYQYVLVCTSTYR